MKSITAYVRLHTKDVFQNYNTRSARHLLAVFPPWNINVVSIKVYRKEADFFSNNLIIASSGHGKVAHKLGV